MNVVHVFILATGRNPISELTFKKLIAIRTLVHFQGDRVPKTAEIVPNFNLKF